MPKELGRSSGGFAPFLCGLGRSGPEISSGPDLFYLGTASFYSPWVLLRGEVQIVAGFRREQIKQGPGFVPAFLFWPLELRSG